MKDAFSNEPQTMSFSLTQWNIDGNKNCPFSDEFSLEFPKCAVRFSIYKSLFTSCLSHNSDNFSKFSEFPQLYLIRERGAEKEWVHIWNSMRVVLTFSTVVKQLH